MNIEVCKLSFNGLRISSRYSEKIRGYLGNKYINNDILHNHNKEKFIYRYPLVQYKVINGLPIVIGINEGAASVANIGINEDCLVLDGAEFKSLENSITKSSKEFGCNSDYIEYKFETPWIALNQKNIGKYKKSSDMEKEEILKKILIGNVISMCKGLNYTVEDKLNCWINLKETDIVLKNVKHTAFVGNFKVNFNIPDYLGIGKSVSKGFGTIMRC